jgi:hypothetical protein
LSHVVNVWEQPQGLPMPADAAGIWKMLQGLHGQRLSASSPKFIELARRMNTQFPIVDGKDDTDVWNVGPLVGDGDDAVWNIGIRTGERFGEVHATLAMSAVALGLNVADEQADHLYLADGRILSPSPGAQCTPAFAAYFAGDLAKAWAVFLGLGAQGNPVACYNLAGMVMRGEAGRKNAALAHALLLLGDQPAEAARLRERLKPEGQRFADALLPRLQVRGQFVALVERSVAPVQPPSPRKAGGGLSLAPLEPSAPAAVPAPAPAPAPKVHEAPPVRRRRPPAPEPAARRGWHRWHLGLLIGAVGPLPILLLPSLRPLTLRSLLLLVVVTGAWGVWRCARDLGLSTTKTVLLVLLALIPFLGMLICIGMMFELTRRRRR